MLDFRGTRSYFLGCTRCAPPAPRGRHGVVEVGLAMTTDSVHVRGLEAGDANRWNAFVARRPEATFFHRAEWAGVLEQAFGHQAHYLLAESAGTVRGILPLGRVRSRLFGDALISTPFCVYGGVVADDDEARAALTREACALAERLGVDYLELRNRARCQPDWPAKDLYVTFRKTIDPDYMSRDGSLEFWSNGGMLNEVSSGSSPTTYESFHIVPKKHQGRAGERHRGRRALLRGGFR